MIKSRFKIRDEMLRTISESGRNHISTSIHCVSVGGRRLLALPVIQLLFLNVDHLDYISAQPKCVCSSVRHSFSMPILSRENNC